MKKTLLTLFVVTLLSLSILPTSTSLEAVLAAPVTEDIVSPASEETVWYNRIYNGMLQRRLWSITYRKWLTEWEDVAPVN